MVWPASTARATTEFDFVLGSDVPFSARRQLVAAFNTASAYFRDRHDINLEHGVTVLASRDLDHLAKILTTHPRGPGDLDYSTRVLKTRCGRSEMGGLQFTGVIVLCLPRKTPGPLALTRLQIINLKRLAVHELAHEVQAQLAAFPRMGLSQGDYYTRAGPNWLVEGAAMSFEFDFLGSGIATDRWISVLLSQESFSVERLDQLRAPGTVIERNDYLLSALTTQLALKDRDLATILAYWRNLGTGIGPEAAFKAAFGREFDSVRESLEDILARRAR